ncbi:hypothetical protein C5L39_02930 [Corynebacterium alimapuense]|uniref:Uncharacterized protein n=1 Tax=Corynebacterium alimapuense TaxID=1576874 RepID=A0A3M8KA54_9CORY|nr:hypothetical protein [Corynebacterium alimapuense]RNE49749.1 hypothetical protein C5L39_02930 [Corynebacterium alimapuense]
MNANLLVMPAGPALVKQLAPQDLEGAKLLAKLRELIDALPSATPIDLVGSRASRWITKREGSFGAWGAPEVNVGKGHHLPELIQRYALGKRAEQVEQVRGQLGQPRPGVLTLVAIDGSAGLTPRAPLALLDQAPEVDHWCRQLLAGQLPEIAHNAASLSDAGIIEPELWLELASLQPQRAELINADISLGVGRYVARWEI